jgi:putative ABC transport system permease protein
MRLIDYILIAFRNIRRQKLRSALTIFAVVIGATSVTIMLALVLGAKNFVAQQFDANGTLQQVAVSPKANITSYKDIQNNSGGGPCTDCVKLTDAMVAKITALPHVSGVARVVDQGGSLAAISYGSKKLDLQQVTAYDANGIITNTMLAGRDINASDTTGVITITSDYADALGFKGNYKALIGKQVTLQTQGFYTGIGAVITPPSAQPGNNPSSNQQAPTNLTAIVVGVADDSNNGQTIRVPLDWMRGMQEQRMYQQVGAPQQTQCQNQRGPCNSSAPQFTLVTTDELAANGYSSLTVKADSTKDAAAVASSIKQLGVSAADASTFIKAQLQIFNIIGLVLGGIGGIALAVAAIGVVNTMIMAILERTREIGVMRAVGAKRSTVRRLFTFEASLLGFWGGVFGVGVGYGLTRVANVFINKQLSTNSLTTRNIVTLPLWLIVAVIGITTIIGMLAGLYPARRAAKLDPVEALHYE